MDSLLISPSAVNSGRDSKRKYAGEDPRGVTRTSSENTDFARAAIAMGGEGGYRRVDAHPNLGSRIGRPRSESHNWQMDSSYPPPSFPVMTPMTPGISQ